MSSLINYFKEDVSFNLRKICMLKKWLSEVALTHQHYIAELNYIFCSDEYLCNINKQYLKHDTYTDIITFDNAETPGSELAGDIFVSIDRVTENAHLNNERFSDELSRVMVHGLLHLVGFSDKTADEQASMRNEEDKALKMLPTKGVPRGTSK